MRSDTWAEPEQKINQLLAKSRENYALGNYKIALEASRETLVLADKHLARDEVRRGQAYNNIAANLYAMGRYDEAYENYAKGIAVYESNPAPALAHLAVAYSNQAEAARFLSREADAEKAFLKAISLLQKLDPGVLLVRKALPAAHHNLGVLLGQIARYDEAEPHLQKALELQIQFFGANSGEAANAYSALGGLYLETGRLEAAETMLLTAIRLTEQNFGPNHDDIGFHLDRLADLYLDQNRGSEALAAMDRSLAIKTAVQGADSPMLADALLRKAGALAQFEKNAEAEAALRRAVSLVEKHYGEKGSAYGYTTAHLGLFLVHVKRFKEAEPVLAKAALHMEQYVPYVTDLRFDTYMALAESYERSGRKTDSEDALDKATGLMIAEPAAATKKPSPL